MKNLPAKIVGTIVAKKERGATAVEYGIMVALIAAVIITVVVSPRRQLTALFSSVGTAIDLAPARGLKPSPLKALWAVARGASRRFWDTSNQPAARPWPTLGQLIQKQNRSPAWRTFKVTRVGDISNSPGPRSSAPADDNKRLTGRFLVPHTDDTSPLTPGIPDWVPAQVFNLVREVWRQIERAPPRQPRLPSIVNHSSLKAVPSMQRRIIAAVVAVILAGIGAVLL